MWARATRKHLTCLVLAAIALPFGGGPWLPAARAITTLDPQHPGTFTQEGTQPFKPGPVLTLMDQASEAM